MNTYKIRIMWYQSIYSLILRRCMKSQQWQVAHAFSEYSSLIPRYQKILIYAFSWWFFFFFFISWVVTITLLCSGFFHLEEDQFMVVGDMDSIADAGDESVEQEGPFGEGLVEAEVEHKMEGSSHGCRNAADGNPTNVGSNDAQLLTWDVVDLGASEQRESIQRRELGAHFPDYFKPGRELYFFTLFSSEYVTEAGFKNEYQYATKGLT